ncbi:trifunctional purine biosynthetic protein adenosine-3 [Drosophila grimshawi]|uniref:Trifunctional purine biosynthetic protein adenosine-3 n=1 Tax=Drosophila grimshawi TaxID=7222 RepID=B4JQ39_DROGR|nr:trifunctional purine biosynthetic protein adenosine-3 [Drosophila grimshawi]EDV99019.1 GH13636 [Drosophila grimshawi]
MTHRVLVIGSGGREHAICWKLTESAVVSQIYALPGSFGIAQLGSKCQNLDADALNAKDFEAIAKWCKLNKISLVVVGPEDPLALGLGDVLQKAGIACFGPGKQGAQIEADKKWAKDFMLRHGIPTARYESFTDVAKAKKFIRSAPYPALVVKAAGLAAGKGVVVAANVDEACQAVDEILGQLKYGQAGATLVVEELLEGEEVSVLAFTDGTTIEAMLPAQDHKRLANGDSGPNTGGMGAYCPCPLISKQALELVQRAVLERAVKGLIQERIAYQGVLYAGLMLTRDGPRVLEFNCRFGDPETQVILPLLESDLFEVMLACCTGQLDKVSLQWRTNLSAVGVVLASAGYPETSTKGCLITGLPAANTETQLIFHSGLAVNAQKEPQTNGGRVLIAVALDASLRQAAAEATKLAGSITFAGAGAQYRTDIAQKAFKMAPVPSLSYKDSGVDIDAGDALVQRIKPLSRGTQRPGVLGSLGGFGGLFRINELSYKQPIIAEATQGVGAKIQLALQHELYDHIGYDLFAMCANELLELGAEPVAFLDYIACGKLQVPLAAQLVKGMADGCRDARCALVGGETAEMPSLYTIGQYDMAGYCVGLVEESQVLPRFDSYQAGDLVVGLPSSGLHCAGFNELLTQLAAAGVNLKAESPVGGDHGLSLAQVLGTPTRLYVQQLLPHLQAGEVKGVAHVSHGLLHDVDRLLPVGFDVVLDFGAVPVPPIFGWLAAQLKLSAQALLERHNCGIGMLIVLPQASQLWRTALPGAKVLGVLQQTDATAATNVPRLQVRNFEQQLQKLAAPFGGLGSHQLPQELVKPQQQLPGSVAREECFENAAGRRLTRLPAHYTDPILILGTDGVGTKLKIAQQSGHNGSVGIDLVAMCVNDILCNGAEPFSFSSYYACGKWQQQLAAQVAAGVLDGTRQANSSFIDAHIAALPLLYEPQVYDLAGFALGVAERAGILPRLDEIQPGDVLIGLPSSGVHSNGFSLVHAVLKRAGLGLNDRAPFSERTLGEELLVPTKIYVEALAPLLATQSAHGIKALAHITGGGLSENLPRVLRKELAVRLDANKFQLPPVFGWLAAAGNIAPSELQRTYNCGLGLILVVAPDRVESVMQKLRYSQRAAVVGEVIARKDPKKSQVVVHNFEAAVKRSQQLLGRPRRRVAVLISGNGSNLQALIDATRDSAQALHAEITLVISNKAAVFGLERAAKAGIPALIISHRDFASREDYDTELTRHLVAARVDLVCLAGFMRVLSAPFVRQWRGRLINIHPSLLPKYPGLHVQQQALDAGEKESGCTVHFVDEGVDTGAILVQAPVPIIQGDDVDSLTQRIHVAEHWAFPHALALLANGAISHSAKEH